MVMYTFNSFNLLTPKHELIQDCLKIKAILRNIRAYYDLRDDIMITFFFALTRHITLTFMILLNMMLSL